MNKLLIALLGLLLLGFLAVTAVKQLREDTGEASEAAADGARRRDVTSFWLAYHSATRDRSEGRFEDALRHYEEALRMDSSHEESIYYLGNCWFELGNFEEAIRNYERLIGLNPRSQRGNSQLGAAYSSLLPGATLDLEKARQAFVRSSEINPEQSGPFLDLGRLALLESRPEEALNWFKTAAGFRSPEGNFQAGFVEFQLGRHVAALGFFSEVFAMVQAEQAISGRGMVVEGDVDRGDRTLSPLEAAGIKSRLIAFWAARAAGPSAPEIPDAFRLNDVEEPGTFQVMRQPALEPPQGRGAWGDFDADGDLDLLFAAATGPVLLENHAGLLKRRPTAALDEAQIAWDACWADFDGDGDLDLYVVGSGLVGTRKNLLLRNDLDGNSGHRDFMDVTAESGISGDRSTLQAVFADYNSDGRVDLIEVGRPSEGAPGLRLYRNLGGRFREESGRAGVRFDGTAVSLVCVDFNSDSRTDLFVLRWHRPALLYLNQGDGTFLDDSAEAGVSDFVGQSYAVIATDYDRDSLPDLLVATVADYAHALELLFDPTVGSRRNTPRLFRNSGNARFVEVTQRVGLNHPYGVFQLTSADIDRDGWPDLVFANGGMEPDRLEPSLVLRNEEGKAFRHWAYLPDLQTPARSWGVSVADVNGDGQPELYLAGVGLLTLKRSRWTDRPSSSEVQ